MKLLLVENHRVFAQTVVSQFLSEHQVTVVSSLAEARAAGGFEVALVDYDLDDGKGDALVAELRRGGFRGRVIAISSHEAGNAALLRAGADAVCSKMEFARIAAFIGGPLEAYGLHVPARGVGEDVAEIFRVGSSTVAVIADGAGGSRGGREAAQAVATAMREVRTAALAATTWVVALDAVARDLAARDEGRTTAVVVATDGVRVCGASVGDSEAWAIGSGSVRRLTEHQRRKPLLGDEGAIVTGFAAELRGATLLLGSDGLLKYASAEAIAKTVLRSSPLPDVAAALVDLTRLTTSELNDDVSVVLIRPGA